MALYIRNLNMDYMKVLQRKNAQKMIDFTMLQAEAWIGAMDKAFSDIEYAMKFLTQSEDVRVIVQWLDRQIEENGFEAIETFIEEYGTHDEHGELLYRGWGDDFLNYFAEWGADIAESAAKVGNTLKEIGKDIVELKPTKLVVDTVMLPLDVTGAAVSVAKPLADATNGILTMVAEINKYVEKLVDACTKFLNNIINQIAGLIPCADCTVTPYPIPYPQCTKIEDANDPRKQKMNNVVSGLIQVVSRLDSITDRIVAADALYAAQYTGVLSQANAQQVEIKNCKKHPLKETIDMMVNLKHLKTKIPEELGKKLAEKLGSCILDSNNETFLKIKNLIGKTVGFLNSVCDEAEKGIIYQIDTNLRDFANGNPKPPADGSERPPVKPVTPDVEDNITMLMNA